MLQHKNLRYDDKVFLKGINPEINGTCVIVKGVASRNIIDSYIVVFEDGKTRMTIEQFGQKPIEYNSFVVPEVCLSLEKTVRLLDL